MRRLLLTARALEDLVLSEEFVGVDARDIVDHVRNDLVVDERAQQPEGQEWTQHLPNNHEKVFSLHSGRDRGVTGGIATGTLPGSSRRDFTDRVNGATSTPASSNSTSRAN